MSTGHCLKNPPALFGSLKLDAPCPNLSTALPDTGSARFSQTRNRILPLFHIDSYQYGEQNAASGARFARNALRRCTKSGHRVVDGAHSIENTQVTKRDFSLTENIEGVQQDRSLTAS